MNENESYLFHIEQPDEWNRAPDHFWIYGWFVSKTADYYTDIRAFIDDVPFTGMMGMPRPDIEAAYSHWTAGKMPGFALRLEPWVGAKTIRLEILNQNHDWSEFWRVKIDITGQGECKRYQPTLHPDLLEMMYLRLIKHGALNPQTPMANQAKRMVRDFSIKCVDVLPQAPLRGQFEQPELFAHTQYNKMAVLGWIFNEERPFKRLLATTDSVNFNVLTHGIEREDVGKKYPQFPQARYSRFQGMIDINQIAPNPIPIKIFGEYEDGSREILFAKRVYQWSCLEKECRLPPYCETHFKNVKQAIIDSCRELGVKTGGLNFWRESRRIKKIFEEDSQDPTPWYDWQSRPGYATWTLNNQLRPRLRQELQLVADQLAADDGPTFSILIDSRDTPWAQLLRLTQSIQKQLYSRWQVLFVIRADADPALTAHVQALGESNRRIVFAHGQPEENFSISMNNAVGATSGDWLIFPSSTSRFAPEALILLAEEAASDDHDLVFTDEDYVAADGTRSDPIFKTRWSPELVFSGTHPGEGFTIRRQIFEATGGFEEDFHRYMLGALCQRLPEVIHPRRTAHVPVVAYHRADSEIRHDAGSETIELSRLAVANALERRNLPGQPFQPPFAVEDGLNIQQVYWESSYLAENPVTIVIPTRDHCDLLERCIQALLQTVNWQHVKLIIVDDFSREEKAVRFLQCLSESQDFNCRVIQPKVEPTKPFNYSRLVNAAEPYIDTPLVLHLNNDVDALKPGWIEEMAGWFSIDDIGVVGARLLYADDHINHAGVIIGPHHGLADIPLAGLGPNEDAPFGLHRIARNCSAVTGACLMTRTDLYRKHQGFDQEDLGVCYNDVDYCLRLEAQGFRTVYTPRAELWHWGSASRGTAFYPDEHIAFVSRYRGLKDPYWNQNLAMKDRSVAVDPYHYVHTKRLNRLHLVVVTHNLNFEGAPLFLFEYVKFHVEQSGFKIDVISTEDGPLRKKYEAMGSRIILVDRHPLHGARNDTEFAEQLEIMRQNLQQKIDLDPVDAFICNTLACWWGVHLADTVKKPSLFYIHESATLKRFFSTMLPKDRFGVVREAFRMATRVCFLCKATRAYYEELNDYDNFRNVSSWIDLARIEDLKKATTSEEARKTLGYSPNEIIIANIGTVCERKGQHMFLRTVKYYLDQYAGGGKFRFLIVGGRPGEYQDSLIADIDQLGLSQVVEIINETDRAYEYFRAANIFVCTSFEESFPRVLLEAMAFETSIVSTHVHGIPEMVTDRDEAYLVAPGNPIQFAKTIKTCLDKIAHGTSTTANAFSRVYRGFDMDAVLPKHADLAREAVLDFDPDTDHSQPNRLSGRGDRVESSW